MKAVDISIRDARRIALAAQGFGGPLPTGRIDRRHFRRVLDQLGTVQLDSVNVLTRTHELVFFARLGTYDRDALTRWLWADGRSNGRHRRDVFEYWGHMASLNPVERHPLFRWRMDEGHEWAGVSHAAGRNPQLLEATLAEVFERGPLSAGEFESHGASDRRRSSWWGWGDGKRVLEWLFWTGKITATRRTSFERVYVAPEQWLPAEILDLPTPTEAEAKRELLLVAARCLGIGTARDLADYFRIRGPLVAAALKELVADGSLLATRVEGWSQPAYLHPEARQPKRSMGARALLSPFDSLIWERQRTERLWGLHYRIEIYTPAPKRVYGYYVLPFLLDEAIVGRVDLKADRKAGVLRVQSAWAEAGNASLSGLGSAPAGSSALGRPAGSGGRAGSGALGGPAGRGGGPSGSSALGGRVPDGHRGLNDLDYVASELAATLEEMAQWLGLASGVTVVDRGDLAPTLARALT
ncbi:MAG: winged helix-turn-helix domain-containing protein [Acidimicrobiales bacterium]